MILIKIKVIIHNSKCEYFKHVLKYQLNSELNFISIFIIFPTLHISQFLGDKCDWWSDERLWWIANWKQDLGARTKKKEIVHSSDYSTWLMLNYLFIRTYLLILMYYLEPPQLTRLKLALQYMDVCLDWMIKKTWYCFGFKFVARKLINFCFK